MSQGLEKIFLSLSFFKCHKGLTKYFFLSFFLNVTRSETTSGEIWTRSKIKSQGLKENRHHNYVFIENVFIENVFINVRTAGYKKLEERGSTKATSDHLPEIIVSMPATWGVREAHLTLFTHSSVSRHSSALYEIFVGGQTS